MPKFKSTANPRTVHTFKGAVFQRAIKRVSEKLEIDLRSADAFSTILHTLGLRPLLFYEEYCTQYYGQSYGQLYCYKMCLELIPRIWCVWPNAHLDTRSEALLANASGAVIYGFRFTYKVMADLIKEFSFQSAGSVGCSLPNTRVEDSLLGANLPEWSQPVAKRS